MVMEMVSSYWLAVLIGLLIGSSITASGMYVLGFRRVRKGDRTLLVPEIDRRPLRVRWREFRARIASSELRPRAFLIIVTLMVLTVVGGLVQNTLFNLHQRECNEEFQSTSLELRQIATRDRELENRDDLLRNLRDDLLSDLVKALAEPPPPFDDGAEGRRLLQEYNTAVARLDLQRDQLIAERAELERQRRAQPEPEERC
ncbi:hypothetical protein IU414_06680 [Nocardia farcinica]|uniref:hypothetical protein n=1 Tax=Nocardia farcinica TaxID=37329 RepID=UPI0018961255|nr:hypothetical protein [Nocardia farcinica]MBF6254388.1 hypothetical protein [Nocardia farcinica]MBF6584444.1 hypothetical protein [Nocardia farcinica]